MSKSITNVKVCESLWDQGNGLTFRFPKKPFAYIFPFKKPAKHAITMMFVFYSIDIIFLNEKNEIVEIKKNLKPFRNYFPKKKFLVFIEFPSGLIDTHNLKLGQLISWSKKSVDFR